MTTGTSQNAHSSSSNAAERPGSLEEWGNRRYHRVTLESGQQVTIKFLDLDGAIRQNAIPEQLLQIALREATATPLDGTKLAEQIKAGELDEPRKLISDLVDLQRWITVESVVEPKITLEDVESGRLPAEDFELLRRLAMRERNYDARGVFLGVVPLDLYTTFRDLHDGAAAEGHPAGLDPGCEACAALEDELSSYRVDRVPLRLQAGTDVG